MVYAYVMIKANTGEAERLRNDVDDIDGTVDAYIVAGDVDIITTVDVDSPAAVKNIAASAIQDVDGVEDTQTYIAME